MTTNPSVALRSLLIYAVCVPLAIFVGFLLSTPLQYSTFYWIGGVALVLGAPLLLKWHYPLMLLSWNMGMIVIFLKGSPQLFLVMVVISLGIAVFERALNREGTFIHVKEVALPLLCLTVIVLITAKLTGGFGLRAFGSDVYGGKKYVFLIVGILGYVALSARRVPVEKARLYITLFFIGGLACAIGDLYTLAPSAFYPVFWFFPPVAFSDQWVLGTTRMNGISAAALALYSCLMARYGIRDIFLSGKLWRQGLFLLAVSGNLLGGFRSALAAMMVLFAIQFFLEGLHRTKLLPAFVLMGVLGLAVMIPFASKLPFTFQRAMAFLPLELDTRVKNDARGSSEWRLEMWKALLPQVPRYLLVGKGYAITQEDWQMMGTDTSFRAVNPGEQGLALSGDYHNGPLSVLIPFGIWGAMAFTWFMGAAIRVVYRNYRYGDPQLRIINSFLLALTVKQILFFLFIFGSLSSDIGVLVGAVGLSVAFNGGVRRPVAAVQPVESARPSPLLPQTRPTFQR